MVEEKTLTVYDKFESLLSLCTEEHLKTCMCQNDLYKLSYNKFYKKYVIDVIKGAKKLNMSLVEIETLTEQGKIKVKKLSEEETVNICTEYQLRCHVERKEIKKTIELFDTKYKLNDPRAYMIVKSVLNHQLSAHRMQQHSNHHGIVHKMSDDAGNTFYKLNPVEEIKRRFDDSVVDAIKKLNDIYEGQKVSGNLGIAVVSAEEVFGKVIDVKVNNEPKSVREIK